MIENKLDGILQHYQNSFLAKSYAEENDDLDLLMNVFGISPQLKRENRQYWGRELGMCWERLVKEICKTYCSHYSPAPKFDNKEPCDLVVGQYAIETKYRVGSGDSNFQANIKLYGPILTKGGHVPVVLFLRNDNLQSAINACKTGGWQVHTDENTYQFIQQISDFDLKAFLEQKAGCFPVNR